MQVAPFEGVGERGIGGGARRRRLRRPHRLDGRRDRFVAQPVALGVVRGLDRQHRLGKAEPGFAAVAVQRRRAAKGPRGRARVVLGERALTARHEHVETGVLRLARGKPRREATGILDQPVLHEGKIGRRQGLGLDRDLDHLACDRAGEGVERADAALQEAPLGGRVVGESLAGRIADARRLAGLQRDVLQGRVVVAVVVGVLDGDDSPFGLLGLGVCGT